MLAASLRGREISHRGGGSIALASPPMDKLRAVDVLGKDWVVAVLLLVIGVVAWVNMVSPKQWTVVRRSFFAFRLGKQSLRD